MLPIYTIYRANMRVRICTSHRIIRGSVVCKMPPLRRFLISPISVYLFRHRIFLQINSFWVAALLTKICFSPLVWSIGWWTCVCRCLSNQIKFMPAKAGANIVYQKPHFCDLHRFSSARRFIFAHFNALEKEFARPWLSWQAHLYAILIKEKLCSFGSFT